MIATPCQRNRLMQKLKAETCVSDERAELWERAARTN
jgi:hypothetical protein